MRALTRCAMSDTYTYIHIYVHTYIDTYKYTNIVHTYHMYILHIHTYLYIHTYIHT